MSALINIDSPEDWENTLSSKDVVIADFYADWCGPCKAIAPHFSTLATQKSTASTTSTPTIAFCKINVDKQQAVAQECKIRAMPTFLVFRDKTVVDVIQGANVAALTAAVERATQKDGVEPTQAAVDWAQGKLSPGVFSLQGLMNMLPYLLLIAVLLWRRFS